MIAELIVGGVVIGGGIVAYRKGLISNPFKKKAVAPAPVAVNVTADTVIKASPVAPATIVQPAGTPVSGSTPQVTNASANPYAGQTVRQMLGSYKSDNDKLAAMAATLTQRNTVRGEVEFQKTQTLDPTFKPTIEDLKSIVNDDPNHRLPSTFGHDVDDLHENMGSLLMYARDKQKANGIVANTADELAAAALSGDYALIRGLDDK